MRVTDFYIVEPLVHVRQHLVAQRDDGRISLTIAGMPVGEEFLAAVEPTVRRELDHRIAKLDHRLRQLGVQVD